MVTDGATLSAEKGRLREAGNLLFHTSLLLLLAGVGLGAAYGYSGTVLVVEGSSFTNSLINYDQFTSGPLLDRAGLPPFSLKLTSFDASYQPDGTPRTFTAHVAARTDLAGAATPADIAVNAPWRDGSAKVYLIGHGYAPHFTVRDASGRVWFDQYVPCTPRDENFTSTCTVKVPDTGLPAAGPNKRPQQLAFTGVFFPTTRLDPREGYVSAYPALQAPGLTLRALVGDLHLANGVPQNVYSVDESAMRQVPVSGPAGTRRPAQVLAPGNPKQRTLTGLPGGMTLTVDDVRQFATFQIKSDPYKGLVLVAAVLAARGARDEPAGAPPPHLVARRCAAPTAVRSSRSVGCPARRATGSPPNSTTWRARSRAADPTEEERCRSISGLPGCRTTCFSWRLSATRWPCWATQPSSPSAGGARPEPVVERQPEAALVGAGGPPVAGRRRGGRVGAGRPWAPGRTPVPPRRGQQAGAGAGSGDPPGEAAGGTGA